MKKKQTGQTSLSGNAKRRKALAAEAEKLRREALQKVVASTLNQIDLQKITVEELTSAIDIMEKRVEAIKAGDFTVDEQGSITFTNAELQKDQWFVTICHQCGYPKTVIAKL